ncbi:MAG: RusA family crossover junction endodeoxyribonuclease [Caulobacteraceae bacterium]|nr:RusA family crossover junction endodeoxyribonuclease [Caulobacteraceae bacterium]
MAITFSVPGDPVPQPRPRITVRGKHGHAYVPKDHPIHAYRQAVAVAARAAGVRQATGPVSIIIDAVFSRPKSHLNKSGVKPTAPALPRPDVDNLGKAVLDALQDLIGDDTHVGRLLVEKTWGTEGRTTVRIT